MAGAQRSERAERAGGTRQRCQGRVAVAATPGSRQLLLETRHLDKGSSDHHFGKRMKLYLMGFKSTSDGACDTLSWVIQRTFSCTFSLRAVESGVPSLAVSILLSVDHAI